MSKYRILSPIRMPDGIVKPGDPSVEWNDKDAAELIALGAIEPDTTGQPSVPTDPAEREALIADAIGKLDPNNTDLWLRDGKPDTNAIAEITGWPVSAAERNTVWAALKPAV